MKNKKGISPLIATVLILGFTVALAAVIMTWGTGFTRNIQEATEETSNVQVVCATDVLFNLKSVCVPAGGDGFHYRITISNDGNMDIKKFVIRYYASPDNVTQADALFGTTEAERGITKFGIESDEITDSKQAAVKMIEAIPVVEIGGKSITCTQNIDAYGDAMGTVIGSC